jgi:hypothetical protein
LAGAINVRANAGESNTIQIALVGCGGRGAGAAENALSTEGPVKLVAMADAFEDRLQASLRNLSKKFAQQVDVPKERQFVGIEGFQKAIDMIAPGGVALLATPPAFRPIHVEYAYRLPCMEKAFGGGRPGACGGSSKPAGCPEEEPRCRRPDEPALQAARRSRRSTA